ncbi:MAG: rod-binding protein [Deltaproteobacteria bacterium]|nr:rod-binding protein [Deltaproteobacteria bacterium]
MDTALIPGPFPSLTSSMNQGAEDVQRKLDMDRLRRNLSAPPSEQARLREACEGFEAIFIQKIWEQMRQNAVQFGQKPSREESMRQGMYDQEFARKMASAGGIGLADMLYEQLSRRMGQSNVTGSPRNNPQLPVIPAGSSPSARLRAEDLRPEAAPASNLQPAE